MALVRRPTTAVALLGVAVVVGVVQGQPPPASRDSGRSVPAERSYTASVGTLLVVADGSVLRFDTLAKKGVAVPLPRGVSALRAWSQADHDVVLGRIGNGRTVAYALGGRSPLYLGAAEAVVPSYDGRAVWVVSRQVATRVPLAGGAHRRVPLPPHARLVADTPSGLIVSTGTVPDPPLAPGRVATPTPSASATTPTPSASATTPTPSAGATTPAPSAGATTPAPTGTVPAEAGGTPATSGPARSGPATPTAAAPSTPTPSPTTPPYTTASPVPSTGPDGVPLTTLVVGMDGRTRYQAAAEAVAAVGNVVLLRDDERRLGVISPRPGVRLPRLLPSLSAIQVIGPGTLDARGDTFAVLGRTNDHAWLMVGPTAATTNGEINVVALDGGAPLPGPAAPAFTASGRVLTVRPDGRIVYYAPGEPDGFTVADELPPAGDVSQA
jgi:hypothetical protein